MTQNVSRRNLECLIFDIGCVFMICLFLTYRDTFCIFFSRCVQLSSMFVKCASVSAIWDYAELRRDTLINWHNFVMRNLFNCLKYKGDLLSSVILSKKSSGVLAG